MSDARLAKLRWRCRRGMKELDGVLVDWLERHGADGDLVLFERLLEAEDTDLWHWVTGRRAPDDAALARLVGQIRSEYKP